jgi:hypothetical protein
MWDVKRKAENAELHPTARMWSAFNLDRRDTRAGKAIDSRREILPDGIAFTGEGKLVRNATGYEQES